MPIVVTTPKGERVELTEPLVRAWVEEIKACLPHLTLSEVYELWKWRKHLKELL
mgnify:CR=1 FL=1